MTIEYPKLRVFEGDLYRTSNTWRIPCTLLRPNYNRHHTELKTIADLKATLRAGKYTNLGSYPLFLFTIDGTALCFDCAWSEFRNICHSMQNKSFDGWRITGCAVNWEDNDLYCDHCSNEIESAYGE